MSDSVWPHRRQPTRLARPWDSPGKNTGVGCHFLLQCMKVKSESEVAQLCLTLSDPMDCSLPGSSIHGILQARGLEWGAIASSETYAPDSSKMHLVTTSPLWLTLQRWLYIWEWKKLWINKSWRLAWTKAVQGQLGGLVTFSLLLPTPVINQTPSVSGQVLISWSKLIKVLQF